MGSFGNVGNNDFLACWTCCQHKPNRMVAVQDFSLTSPPMAAFLVARNVERLRVQLREPTASNAGAKAADGD